MVKRLLRSMKKRFSLQGSNSQADGSKATKSHKTTRDPDINLGKQPPPIIVEADTGEVVVQALPAITEPHYQDSPKSPTDSAREAKGKAYLDALNGLKVLRLDPDIEADAVEELRKKYFGLNDESDTSIIIEGTDHHQ